MAPKKGKTGKVVNPMFGKEDPPARGKLTVDVGDDDEDDGGEPGVRPRSPSQSSSEAGEMTPKRAALKQRIAERQLAKYESQSHVQPDSAIDDPLALVDPWLNAKPCCSTCHGLFIPVGDWRVP